MHARGGLLVFALASVGCHNCGDEPPEEESDTDPFAGSDGCGFICTSDGSSSGAFTTVQVDDTSAESSSTTGPSGPQDECRMSSECGEGSFCVAPFDQALGPEGKGAYACVVECVPLVDEDLWCADATACCDPDAVCTDRGYCELPQSTGTAGSDTGTAGSDTAGSDSGGSESSDGGDDSGTGSSSTSG